MLPSNSKTKARQANDDDYAEMVFQSARLTKPKKDDRQSWSPDEWSPEMTVMADMIGELRYLRAITIAKDGGSWKQPVPYDRLNTKVADAARRGREHGRRERHEARLDILLPNRRK